MSNVYKSDVWVVDTTGALALPMTVQAIKLVAGSANATLTLKESAVSGGTTIYSTATAANTEKLEYVDFRDPAGLYATITGTGAVAYIYQKTLG